MSRIKKRTAKDEPGTKTGRNPKGASQSNPNEAARPKRTRAASRPDPNSPAKPKAVARTKRGSGPTTKAGTASARGPRRESTGQIEARVDQERERKTALSLHIREFDVLAELKFQRGDRQYVLRRVGRGVSALLAVMIVAALDPSAEDGDDRGWIHDLNFAALMTAIFEFPCDPSDGRLDVLKKHVYKLRRALAIEVGGAYDGEARAWAHEVVVHEPARGYRLNLPTAALRMKIEKPPRWFPDAKS